MKLVEHRVADRRVVRLIRKWLRAGVLEDGEETRPEQGTPQGGSISPLLANIYLHYVFDVWASTWRKRETAKDVIFVRYADDIVAGFQLKSDAQRFLEYMRERFARYHLELHPEKTRLIEFGRRAAQRRAKRGVGRPETFNFLGFTHVCSTTRRGCFALKRLTMSKRMQRKLAELRKELRRRMHDSIPQTGRWLRPVLRGHFQYYGVPHNYRRLHGFREAVIYEWRRTLSRRSQKGFVSWERMRRISRKYLPKARIYHPYPNQRLVVR